MLGKEAVYGAPIDAGLGLGAGNVAVLLVGPGKRGPGAFLSGCIIGCLVMASNGDADALGLGLPCAPEEEASGCISYR